MAAKEALTRDLSAELAPHGIRVAGLRPQGMPETRTIREVFAPRTKASGLTWEEWLEFGASRTHPRRLMTLDEVASMAVFMASDQSERDDGNNRQPDHGQPGRLAATQKLSVRRCVPDGSAEPTGRGHRAAASRPITRSRRSRYAATRRRYVHQEAAQDRARLGRVGPVLRGPVHGRARRLDRQCGVASDERAGLHWRLPASSGSSTPTRSPSPAS